MPKSATVPLQSPRLDDPNDELSRQLQTLIDHDYPSLTGLTEAELRALVAPLRAKLADLPDASDDAAFPFVLVVTRDLVAPEQVVPLIDMAGKPGWTDMDGDELARFVPIDGVELPSTSVYLLADIDTGSAYLNVRPMHALPQIVARGRTPLTIDEGLALMLQFPQILKTHNAFQMLASRCGDKRVPAMWVSYRKPRLGWCWDGNPHTWIGMGSAAARLSA